MTSDADLPGYSPAFVLDEKPTAALASVEVIALTISYGSVYDASGQRLTVATVEPSEVHAVRPTLNSQSGIPNDSPRQRHEIDPTALPAFVVNEDVQELKVPIALATNHHGILEELVQAGPPLRWLAIDDMRFDLTDVLGRRLAQLALVLAGPQPSGETVGGP